MNEMRQIRRTGYALLLPAVLFVLAFSVIPFVWNIILSFQKWDGLSDAAFVGFDNFAKVLKTPVLRKALTNSVIYAFSATAGCLAFGLIFATMLLRLSQKEGSIFRLILYSPTMLPTAIVGIMFVFFFNPTMGLLNSFLKLIGLESLQHVWLQDRQTAMACVIFVAIWKGIGSVMMLNFAAMQGIPLSLYESSYLDGASFSCQVKRIILPLIKPTILLSAMNTLGEQFKSYDLISTMTQGGPADLTITTPLYMKKVGFLFGQFGSAAAIGVIFTIIVSFSVILVRRLLRGESYEY